MNINPKLVNPGTATCPDCGHTYTKAAYKSCPNCAVKAYKADQLTRRALRTADGLDAERINARLAFDWEAEAIQKRNEEM